MSSNPYEGSPGAVDREGSSASGIDGGETRGSGPSAGWYPTPSGGQQYWDGARWLELPPPSQSAVPGPEAPAAGSPPKNPQTKKWVLIAVAAVLILGLIGGGIAWKNAHDAQQAEEAAASAAAASAAASASEEKAREDAAA